jgi:hypothetical protein
MLALWPDGGVSRWGAFGVFDPELRLFEAPVEANVKRLQEVIDANHHSRGACPTMIARAKILPI